MSAEPDAKSDAFRHLGADEPPPFDPARVEAWLSERVAGFRGPLKVRRFQGGQSNPTFELIGADRSWVMRRKPSGPLLPSAHAVDREHRVISALHAQGFPAPAPIGLCEDPAVAGAMFYVMETVQGRILREPTLAEAAKDERSAIYLDMIRTLARLHAYEPEAIGLGDFGPSGNYMARQIRRWTKQYRLSETRRIEPIERLIVWLAATVPDQARTSVVHGDFKIDNVVIASDRPAVAGVLDWELSTLGDPLADLSYLLMNWFNGPLAEIDDLAARGLPRAEALIAAYAELAGLETVPALDWHYSYNLFRLACIIQGIVGRVRDGTANSPEAATMAERVPALAEASWKFAVRAGA